MLCVNIQKAVADVGPIAIGVDAAHGLKHYHRGVFSSSSCSPVKLNHGVLVVGYGKVEMNSSSGSYWVIKNR